MTRTTTPLTTSEETFCRTMAVGASAVTAARVAGVRPDLAATIGMALCGRTDIQNRIGVLFAEREAEHAARLQRTIERLDRIHDAALEKGQFGVAYKAITQVTRLIDGETRRLQRGFEELRHPAFPADAAPDFAPEPPPAPRPAPRPRAMPPQAAAPLPGADLPPADLLPAEVWQIIEAELGLAPAAPPPAGSPFTAVGTVLAGPGASLGRAGRKPG